MLRDTPLPPLYDRSPDDEAARAAARAICDRLGSQGHWGHKHDEGDFEFDGTLRGAVTGLIESWLSDEDYGTYCTHCLLEAEPYTDGYGFDVAIRCFGSEMYPDGQANPRQGVDALRQLIYNYAWAIVRLNEPETEPDYADTAATTLVAELEDLLVAPQPKPARRTAPAVSLPL